MSSFINVSLVNKFKLLASKYFLTLDADDESQVGKDGTDNAIVVEPRSTCHPITLCPILHSLRINEGGLALEAGQVGHQLTFNAGITVDSIIMSIMKSGASTATVGSIHEFRYIMVMIKFST